MDYLCPTRPLTKRISHKFSDTSEGVFENHATDRSSITNNFRVGSIFYHLKITLKPCWCWRHIYKWFFAVF